MTLDEKFKLVRSVGEECIQEDELRNLLEKKPNPICYDGFEPSGRMHIAQVNFQPDCCPFEINLFTCIHLMLIVTEMLDIHWVLNSCVWLLFILD